MESWRREERVREDTNPEKWWFGSVPSRAAANVDNRRKADWYIAGGSLTSVGGASPANPNFDNLQGPTPMTS